MRILNIAHGEFPMLGAFVTWAMVTRPGWPPLAMIAPAFGSNFLLGLAVHRLWFKRLRDTSPNVDLFEARALMQSPVGAQLVGIDTARLQPPMFGIGLGLSGVAGGLLLGVVEAVGMHFTSPSLKSLLSYAVFIDVLLLRPNGMFHLKR